LADGKLESVDLLMRKTLINKKTKKYTFFERKCENFATYWRGCSKIYTVILSEAKSLILFFSSQKIKKGDPSDFVLRMTRKGKFTKILEQSHILDEKFRLFIFIFYKTNSNIYKG